ncbi:MAG: hypothetical protein NTW21_44870 [Verrucomicrobia bacterium]|nr:hypothetical protein [Verrucomicrobiota bacterium]
MFGATASGFTVYFFDGATGFTTPTWHGYPAVNMGAATPVVRWLLANGFAYDADLRSDPNNDGVNLLTAYALDLDPNLNLSGSLPKPLLAGNQLSLTFHAGRDDVTYAVETSTDLQTWSTAEVTLTTPDGNKFRTASVSAASPRRFLRLTVSVP